MRSLALISLLAATPAACAFEAPLPSPIPKKDAARPRVNLTEPVRPLTLGVLPVYHPDRMRKTFEPLRAHLEKALRTEVTLLVPPTYGEMIDLVERGELDIFQLAPLSYVTLKDRVKGLRPLATNITEGATSYSGYILARGDLVATKVTDLEGVRFGLVDEHSTSGHLYPLAFLLEHGLNPKKDLGSIVYFGRHDALVRALVRGEIDAGGTYSEALLDAQLSGQAVEKLKILAKTGRIPYDAWCAGPEVDEKVGDKIAEILMSISTKDLAGRKILGPLTRINGFVPVSDSAYNEVRRQRALVRSRLEPAGEASK